MIMIQIIIKTTHANIYTFDLYIFFYKNTLFLQNILLPFIIIYYKFIISVKILSLIKFSI